MKEKAKQYNKGVCQWYIYFIILVFVFAALFCCLYLTALWEFYWERAVGRDSGFDMIFGLAQAGPSLMGEKGWGWGHGLFSLQL